MNKLKKFVSAITLLFFLTIFFISSCGDRNTEIAKTVAVADDTIPYITVNGVNLPIRTHYNGYTMVLNGAGIRKQYFMQIYVAGLYLQERTKDADSIINEDKPVSIRIQIVSTLLTSEIMERAIRHAIAKSIKDDYEQYKDGIDMICGVFGSEPTHKGDVYEIHYTPGIGLSGSKNGKAYAFSNLGAKAQSKIKESPFLASFLKTIKHTEEGHEALPDIWFRKALLRVWLSNDPVDEQLKDSMLGL